ncbi:UDP-N-acetylenolpyruvoylglucosamine reductase MurB [Poriferisphaera corsica]|uniref:UDP-N-acetylenolpyruvoylglucosamine reductase n=1 Tax=Poriferisphaera corsica TaxID=2528020 RepID=A0A517YQN4_9BACT|nr:UDP-N-acetylmuramate dehydrogenase [Poriferisphaera corsica]QDU32537.1 UDP-N-acetylenolpyruvoylglucosamine reductase MurB [Poriferisphaera corsica]
MPSTLIPQLKPLLAPTGIRTLYDAPIGEMTWYKTGGRASALCYPASESELYSLISLAGNHNIPIYILGSGANLLVLNQGVQGIVISLDSPPWKTYTVNNNVLTVKAGYDLMKLIHETAKLGLAGLEPLAGIPASIGGAICMNAGGTFGEIGTHITRVRTMSAAGQIQDIAKDDLQFKYRSTNITDPFILEADFLLTSADPSALRAKVKEIFDYKKNAQPMADRSAGCTFKNPPQPPEGAQCATYKPAGQLIDESNLKGFRIGTAEVSTVHANFIAVDRDNPNADDVAAVIDHVQKAVLEKVGIQLQREVIIWP